MNIWNKPQRIPGSSSRTIPGTGRGQEPVPVADFLSQSLLLPLIPSFPNFSIIFCALNSTIIQERSSCSGPAPDPGLGFWPLGPGAGQDSTELPFVGMGGKITSGVEKLPWWKTPGFQGSEEMRASSKLCFSPLKQQGAAPQAENQGLAELEFIPCVWKGKDWSRQCQSKRLLPSGGTGEAESR